METFIDQLGTVPQAKQPDVLAAHAGPRTPATQQTTTQLTKPRPKMRTHIQGAKMPLTTYIANRTLPQTESRKIEIELRKSLNPSQIQSSAATAGSPIGSNRPDKT